MATTRIVRSGGREPVRRTIETAREELEHPEGKDFGALLQLHLDAGTGHPEGKQWLYSEFARKLDYSRTQIRQWCTGNAKPPMEDEFNDVLVELCLSPPFPEDSSGDLAKRDHAALYTAWARVRGPRLSGNGDQDSVLVIAGRPVVASLARFPSPLPAELAGRRAAIRSAVAVVIASPRGPGEPRLLAMLESHWPGHGLADPDDDAMPYEAIDLFNGLSSALDACNSSSRPWGEPEAPRKDALARARRAACTSIAELLSALIWTPEAWHALPALRAKAGLHVVSEPTLLHAGIAAACGKRVYLPVYRNAARPDGMQSGPGWESGSTFHLRLLTPISAGVDTDHDIAMLNAVAHLFEHVKFERGTDSGDMLKTRIAQFCNQLAGRVQQRTRRENSLFAVSEQLQSEQAPGFSELFDFVRRLTAEPGNPMVQGLPYTGAAGTFVRGGEDAVLSAIDDCRKSIAAIQ